MTTNNFSFYLHNRLIQTSQTGGQWYSETSPFSIPRWNCAKSLPLHFWNSLIHICRNLNEEVNCTEPFPSVSVPWFLGLFRETSRSQRKERGDLHSGKADDRMERDFTVGPRKRQICSGANVIKLFCPQFTDFRNKLECLSPASVHSIV
jgi:hypothetical protein